MIAGNTPENIANMKAALPDLRFCELLPGAGHWFVSFVGCFFEGILTIRFW
jgi:hypothetical protein